MKSIKKETEKIGDRLRSRLKQLCGRPSPAKRLISVLLVCVALAAANIYFLICAFSGVGKNNTGRELMKLEHIEPFELHRKESIHHLESIEDDE